MKTYFRLLGCVWLIFIFGFFILNFLNEDLMFSEMENRSLAQNPRFTVERLLEGRYTTKYETYVNDQFFGRNQWVKLKAQADMLLGKKESNGVYLGADDYLIESFNPASEAVINQNIVAIQSFAKNHESIPMTFLMIPNAVSILSDKLPLHAPVLSQETYINALESQLSQLTFIDAKEALSSHQAETIYYKTDHHWTTLGAYYTFLQVAKVLNLEIDEAGYEQVRVTESFDGTLTSKSGYQAKQLDQIDVYLPKSQTDSYVVSYVEEQQKTTSLYDVDALTGKDKYAVFFGGNHALIKIQTTHLNGRRLLVLKDSYANALLPFLIPSFEEIVIVDPRYYVDDLEELMKNETLNEVLYLYNANTFFNDNSLNLILDPEGELKP